MVTLLGQPGSPVSAPKFVSSSYSTVYPLMGDVPSAGLIHDTVTVPSARRRGLLGGGVGHDVVVGDPHRGEHGTFPCR